MQFIKFFDYFARGAACWEVYFDWLSNAACGPLRSASETAF
jgi:hypothetical protein